MTGRGGSLVGAAGIAGASFGVVKMRRGKRARQEAQQQLAHLEQTSGLALVAADDAVKTSEQELEFARAQFGDAAVAEFATALGLSEKTVESHLRRLFDRYGVLSRTELTVLAIEEGWLAVATRGPR